MMRLAIFGSTGSIGRNTLRLLAHLKRGGEQPGYALVALSGQNNLSLLAQQARSWQPQYLLIGQPCTAAKKALFSGYNGEIIWGEQVLAEFAAGNSCDTLLLAISGSAALPATYAAASTGKRLLLANKEALVAAGELIVAAAGASNATLVPVDSEHNALWQCLGMPHLPGKLAQAVTRLELTASGGPFWNWSATEMCHASVAAACNHPNWRMGNKISVDSATMVNKALELIEAHWLFAMHPDHLDVLVHPQSLVHGLVHMRSGAVLAQLSLPDMRVALASALFGTAAPSSGVSRLSLLDYQNLNFYPPDNKRFAALPLVYQAMRDGQDRCLCFDISNEVANLAFREGRIPFGAIVETIDAVLQQSEATSLDCIEAVRQRQQQLAELAHKVTATRTTATSCL